MPTHPVQELIRYGKMLDRSSRWRSLPGRTYGRAVALVAIAILIAMAAWGAVTRRQLVEWRQQIRRALFIPETLPTLQPKLYGSFSPLPGVIAERVTYGTEYGLRIPAIVYRPSSSAGKIPGIVVVNGHGADKSSWYSWYTGILYARAGAAVLTYDPIGEGERNDSHEDATGEHDTVIDVPGVPQRMGGLMVTDVMQGVSYLRSLPQVDSQRIAVLGFSMGSFISSIAGAVDDRVHALLLTGGGDLDGPGGYWDSSAKVMCQAGPYRALEFLGDRPAAIFTLNARRGPTFILNGSDDTVVAIPQHGPAFFEDLHRRVVAMNGSTQDVFETYFDPGASHRPAWVLEIAAEWLENTLHFSKWSDTEVKTLPVIKIGTWAAENGVHLTPGEMQDNRDSGLEAIDVQVPKLTPEQLSVLPRAEWMKRRSEFVYSTWAKDATAEARKATPTEATR
ncbi:MAG TPA: acetylxylan esterase [Acidobacteriaceae bacterium]